MLILLINCFITCPEL